jgi:anthranilate phosphoribosyltransferase
MRQLATPVRTARDDLLDTAGSGGGRPSFNVSTTAALIAAGRRLRLAKHGNRSATGLSGSADLLEAARRPHRPRPGGRSGAASTRSASASCSPPAHHAADPPRRARSARSSAVRTIFNLLGPLDESRRARGGKVVGVSDPPTWSRWRARWRGWASSGRW